MGTRLVLTRQVSTMLIERGIRRSFVDLAVREPDRITSDPNRPACQRFYKAVDENGGGVLRVVGVPDGDELGIVTVFFDRGAKR